MILPEQQKKILRFTPDPKKGIDFVQEKPEGEFLKNIFKIKI